MKKRSLSLGILMGLLFLSASATFLMPSVKQAENSIEQLRTSAGEITIVTPENKTYTEPDSGYYPATFGFENDEDGASPDDWVAIETGGDISISGEQDGHKKVLKLYDTSTTYGVGADYYFSDPVKGSIEFWFQKTSGPTRCYFILLDSNTMNYAIEGIGDYNGDFALLTGDGVFTDPSGLYAINTWFHLKLDFDSSTDKVNLSINGIMVFEDKNFYIATNNVDLFRFGTNSNLEGNFYVDAVGFSWDSNYNIGDNLNEGLLLSYDNTTTLDWQGNSLDGMGNKTILGNTTIPMPSDGAHRIQVFGNNSVGTMYESNLRYFSVFTGPPEITINSPTPSQVVGSTAPSYDLTITGPYESIWYTLDGGAINLTASSLTGTIDQGAWTALSDGIITIDFYVNNSAGIEESAQVQVIKDSSEEPSGIPGYDLYLLIGALSVISVLIIRKRVKS